jgi:hypothetical protein
MRIGSSYTGESTGELAYDRTNGAFTYKQGNTGSTLTERMRINSSGYVGIGTSSPQTILHLSTTDQSTNRLRLQNTGTSGGNFDIVGGNPGVSNIGLAVYDVTNAATRMYIDSSGNLLVGKTSTSGSTTTDGAMFYKAASGGGMVSYFTNGGTGSAVAIGVQADTNSLLFYRSGTQVGSVSVTSTSTAYNTSSDFRLKENIADADDAATVIDAIQVRKFDWKSDGTHQRYGFVAQELASVAPEAVHQPSDEEEMMAVDYSKLVPMLVKEVQSLRARVAELEGK